jgi:nucleoside-diphosphate-sugar epimerase
VSSLIAFKDGAADVTNILVTGSAGHLGEALMCRLSQAGHQPIGLDIKA